MTEIIPNVLNEIEAKALETVTDFESGKRSLVLEEYIEAVGILKTSNIESPYLKFSPLLTPKITAALQYAQHSIYEAFFDKDVALNFMAGILKLNRKLSLHCHKAPWREEMHIAGIFIKCRSHKFFTKKYLKEILMRMKLDETSIKVIVKILFKTPSLSRLYFREGQDVNEWKQRCFDVLEKFRDPSVPVPTRLIFIGLELGTIYFIKKELKRGSKNAWETSYLSKEDQLWYYGKIAQILDAEPTDNDVSSILSEFRETMLKIYRLMKENKELVTAEK